VTDGKHYLSSAANVAHLIGGSGNNHFVFDVGAVFAGTIDGGEGAGNTLDYSAYSTAVTVDLSTGTAHGTSGVSHIHNLIGGSAGDDLTGDGNDNVITGGAGDDTLDGGGHDQGDTLSYDGADSSVNVNLGTSTVSGGAGSDTISNFENITGSDHDDTLTGDGNANVLDGRGGDDTLDGAGGTDTATYAAAEEAVTVDLTITGADNAFVGDPDDPTSSDELIDIENVTGSAFDDTLTGNADANKLDGAAGDDTLEGGDGDDILTGGQGNDAVSYAGANGVTVDLGISDAQDTGDAGSDTITEVENLIGEGDERRECHQRRWGCGYHRRVGRSRQLPVSARGLGW